MADTPTLFPGNDLAITIGPFETVSDAGVKEPITVGVVSGYIAVAPQDAAPPHANFTLANLTYIGGANGYDAGWWLAKLDAANITDALCEQFFAATGEAYLIGVSANNIRVVVRLQYQRTRWASIAA